MLSAYSKEQLRIFSSASAGDTPRKTGLVKLRALFSLFIKFYITIDLDILNDSKTCHVSPFGVKSYNSNGVD